METRRLSDRAFDFWEETLSGLSGAVGLKQLIGILETEEWSYGFVLAFDPQDQAPFLLQCGPECARSLGIHNIVPRVLPSRYEGIFKQGGVEATSAGIAVRREGEFGLPDGRRELFRIIFIPVVLREAAPIVVAFGTFNCKVSVL